MVDTFWWSAFYFPVFRRGCLGCRNFLCGVGVGVLLAGYGDFWRFSLFHIWRVSVECFMVIFLDYFCERYFKFCRNMLKYVNRLKVEV